MNKDNEMEKPIIYIEEKPEVIEGQPEGEKPTIIVERTESAPAQAPQRVSRRRRLYWVVGGAVIAVMGCMALWGAWRFYRTYNYIGVPVSVTSTQNIEKLQAPAPEAEAESEVVHTSDSLLGVAIDLYEMRGVQAEIWMHEPDTTDQSVYLYSRCADHHKDFSIIGSMVIDGHEIETAESDRKGYFAASPNNHVIGIARDEQVKDYVKTCGGCFFRQYILLSDRTLPKTFYLHGKVERRALARTANDRLYYVASRYKETMWDFADALREYGFVDAIYITGGYDYCFYRSADGVRHDISEPNRYPHKHPGKIPWLVFRRK